MAPVKNEIFGQASQLIKDKFPNPSSLKNLG